MAQEEKVKVVGNDGLEEEITLVDLCKQKEEAGMARTASWSSQWQQSLQYFLSEQLHGLKLDSETEVRDFVTTSDRIRTLVSAYLRGAREVSHRKLEDGTWEVELELPLDRLPAILDGKRR